MTNAVFFDVSDTMLDLAALDPLFITWFGNAGARRAWFNQTLHLAMTLAATRTFRDFGDVGAAALAMTADNASIVLPADAVPTSRGALPAHADVAPALRILHGACLVTAALSNNPLPVVQAQMRGNGLAALLDHIISVDGAGAQKPAPEVY